MFKRIRSLYRVLIGRRDFEGSMTEEMRFHMEECVKDLVRSGSTREEAVRRARLEFGSVNSVEEECREARGLPLFDELRRQLVYAARLLKKTPGFTVTALLTLAICIGANLSIFAVIDAILLRPLPFPDAKQLVTVFNTYPKAGVDRDGSSLPNYYERRGHIAAFSSLAIYRPGKAIVGETGATERIPVMRVSPDFFTTLGAGPSMGRAFTEDETTFDTDDVVVLTDAYWRQHFNADPGAVGRRVRVDGVQKTVVGVLPRDFRFLSSDARLYFPLASRPQDRLPRERHSGGNATHMIARLKSGATIGEAQSQIDVQNAALEADDPSAKMMADAGFRSLVYSLHGDHVASIRPTLLLMQGGVFLLLLIGVVNLMNLLLIRANGRVKELAVRQALGASRRHVVSEVIVETTLLTTIGGILGFAAGAVGLRLLSTMGIDDLPLGAHIGLDMRVGLMALAAAIVIGMMLAAPIAWFNLRHMAKGLQSESRSGTSNRAAQNLRHGFTIAQVSLAFILLSGSGLLGLSLKRAMEVSPGFRPDRVLTGQISLPWSNYSEGSVRLAFTQKLMEELGRQPGVMATGVVTNVPLSGISGKSAAKVQGYILSPGQSPRGHYSYGVTGDYFGALGFVLRSGRFLTADDSRRTVRVCVVDEDFARFYWPNSSALGQRLFEGSAEGPDAEAFTVVGVVGKVKQADLTDEEPQGAIYYPYRFRADSSIFVVARTGLAPESLGQTVQRVVRQIDPDLPVNDLRSMDTLIADSLVARRSPALLAILFSAIAVLLTAIGTYGVLSYAVTQRRREIGVRMALGARPGQIRSQFFFLAMRLLASGMILGVIGAWLTGQTMRTILFHVPSFSVATLGGAAVIMGAVCVVSCLLPSDRAARTSPVEALADQ
jgi:predicted permease